MIRALRRTWHRLLASLSIRRPDDDLAAELECHIQLLADEHISRGMSPGEAYRQARVKFGNLESAKASYRDQRGLPALDMLFQDLRYAARIIRKNPGFATVAILSLAIGIGANTAIYSLVNGVLLKPLLYKDPERIFAAREVRRGGVSPINPMHAHEWGRQCPSLEQVALLQNSRGQVAAGGEPATLPGARIAHNFFAVFGVEPMLGRAFLEEEEQEGRDRVVILSESLWRSRFHGDPALLGQSIVIDSEPHQVVGIVRGPFFRAFRSGRQDTPSNARFELFRPLVLEREELTRPMGNFNYGAVVRLKPGATVEQALAEIDVVQARFPLLAGTDGDLKAVLIPAHELVTGRSLGLWMLTAAVGAVLLIVCINLANLLLSRVAARSREAAVRAALGASRGRQFRQVLTESLLLACCGGALGIVFAGWILEVLVSATTLDIPRLDEVRLDTSVLVFAVSATLLTGLLFGVLPAWRLTRVAPQEALRTGSHTVTEARRGLRLREGLIGVEVGLSTALLILAGLLTFSLDRLLQVEKGFGVDQVLTFDLDTAGPLYGDQAYRERFFTRLLARVNAIPGVEAAGLITQMPLNGQTWNDPIYLEDHGSRSERHVVDNRYASPGYFRAMNIDVLHGRAFDERDRGQGVAVLSKKAAQLLWPGDANPVGRTFMGEDDAIKTLVGIVADVRATLHEAPPAHAYYPYWQRVPGDAVMVVRTSLGPETAAGPLRAALHSEDPQLPIGVVRSMADVIEGSVAQRRFQSMLVLVFAASAMLVASLGIYGVVAYSVARRRNEIGIRMALGAKRSQLLRLIIRQGMTPVVLGLAAGIAAAVVVGRAIRGLLFEIEPADPLTIAAVALALLTVGLLACFIPARRATGPNTVDALRFE